ncbi:PHP domain-containing protein [Lapillicoccus jejuensis]|uniref:Putative hydrolase n=1 Tax=Lapillicoccus jejuensis TaxID=402171 RepID=A0A542E0D3_9MICO|nr:PHP domain-containing protein [Lapillicoccus jejuensis]TQJ08798.1 putative hydrolase [Lapillicoccus jejuensis]
MPLRPLEAPVDPVEALRRIALLLERSRAGSYRIEAFRKAARVVAALEDDELDRRASTDTLTELAGVGDATASVVAQAVAGELPSYLQSWQEKASEPLVRGGDELFAAVVGDLHCHSDWSDGGSPIDEVVLAAVELGQDWLALTDHSPRLKVARGLSAARLTEQLQVVAAVNASLGERFRLLSGIEVDILDDGGLDQSDEMLAQLDVVTASVHSKLRMASAPMTTRMVAAALDPRVNVLGHCTGRLVEGSRGTRPPSEFDARAVFEACLEGGTAVEINSRPERCDPPDELVELARDLGCLFTIDSDAHAPGQLEMKAYGCERAERLGIPPERIVTTWPVDEVLAWSRAGKG